MNAAHHDLLLRLEHYDFDGADTSGGFARRLAHANGWSLDYARRACEEYKRFAFLAVTAAHVCTPSDQVDQVWHLHILQTRSYWDEFCREVLRQPLHHEPARGGADDPAKFRACYARTLRSYAAAFGMQPPPDLWPPVAERFATRHVRVERAEFWVLRKPRWLHSFAGVAFTSWGAARWLALAAAGVGIAGCTLLHGMPPFSFRGAEFLSFFAVLWLITLAVSEVLRLRSDHGATGGQVDPYEEAFLIGGATLAANAAIASVVKQGFVQLEGQRLEVKRQPTAALTALERAAVQLCAVDPQRASLAEVRLALVRRAEEELPPMLEQRGLLVPRDALRHALLVALIAPMFGLIKLGVGLAFDKPVGYLTLACIASILIAIIRYGRRRPTKAGQALLARARGTWDRSRLGEETSSLSPLDMAIILFGAQIVAGTVLAENDQREDGSRNAPSDGGATAYGGGGDGGSDSGGGSDSDGGGGGGGCGGGGGGCGGCGGS